MVILLEMIKVKSGMVRFLHWVIVLTTVTGCVTGFYIGAPVLLYGTGEAYQTFIMAKVRLIHFMSAVCLDVAFLIRLYLAFFSTFHRDWKEVLPTPSNLSDAKKTWKFYWNLEGPQTDYRWVDPFDGLTFLALHMVLVLQLFTGFALYVSGIETSPGVVGLWAATLHFFTDWTVWAFNGLPGVRLVHHLTLWIMITGAFLHIYLQIWKTIKLQRADISAIVSGYKLMAVKPKER